MYREIAHIYGPISIHSFGVMIALGLAVFLYFIQKDPRLTRIIPLHQFYDVLSYATLIGILGGRLLYVISDWHNFDNFFEIFALWHGGFSVLGSIIAIVTLVPWYLRAHHIPILPLLDLAALYAPLIQAVARFGCLFAGCCYGKPTSLPWAITFTDTESAALCFTPLHPTQIYSALFSFVNFLFLYFVVQKYLKKPGQLLSAYIILASLDRFIVDFFRGDQVFFESTVSNVLSLYQWYALGIASIGIAGIIYSSYAHNTRMDDTL